MRRILLRTLVKNDSKNQLCRNFSEMPISTIFTGGGLFFAAVAGYSTCGLWLLKIQLLPLQKGIEKLNTETKERIEKLGTETKERTDKLGTESKERTDKLEMKLDIKFDGLSKEIKESGDKMNKEIKESNEKVNSRVDSVLLRSLDLQRVPKPAGE